MAKTGAERQRESIARLRARASERDALAAEVERQAAAIAELEAELEQASQSGRAARCPVHGTELACPLCYRDGPD